MEEIVLGFITSFFVVLLATPSLVKVAKMKHLVDEPTEARKLHQRSIPTIGGIMIFAGSIFAYALWFPSDNMTFFDNSNFTYHEAISDFKYMIAAAILLFFIGVKDDIIGVAPVKKLVGHFIVGFILVVMADLRIEGMHGLFGLFTIPYWASVLLSVFTYIVVVNAFNLIDGVDGLAAGIGLVISVLFGCWFYISSQLPLSLMSFVLAGALAAFLIFNFSPAKIFMGDSGSLLIGAFVFVMAINCIETDTQSLPLYFRNISAPVFAMSAMSYPLIDTIRVFINRSLKGKSPFEADKNHIHHKLIQSGFNHSKTALILYTVNLAIALTSLFLVHFSPTISFIVMLLVGFGTISLLLLLTSSKFRNKNRQNAA